MTNSEKASQYAKACWRTDKELIDDREKILAELLSDPHCEVTKNALIAVTTVMADRFELLVQ